MRVLLVYERLLGLQSAQTNQRAIDIKMKLTISGKRIVSYLLSVRLITPNSNRRYQEKIPTTNYLTGKLFINYVAPL